MLGLRAQWPTWDLLRKISIILLITLGAGILYIWHLGTLTPGISAAELAARHSSLTLNALTANPLNAPQRLLQYGLQAAGHHGAFWMRLPSVAFAIFFLGLFYLLTKAWFGRVVGILSTAILATTPWIILLARSETPYIMLLSPIAVLVAYGWLMRAHNKHRQLGWLLLCIVAALSLYMPGLIWLVLAGAVVNRTKLVAVTKSLGRLVLVGSIVLALLLLVPLILASARHLSVAEGLVLWPAHWASALVTVKSIVWAALALVWRAPHHYDILISRLPILDDTQMVLVLFGAYALWTKARRQIYALSGLILIGIVGAGINRDLTLITLALPAIAVLVAAGLRYLYVEWRSVFPLNPISKTLAVVVMLLVVSVNVLFGIRYALVAWPHTVATHQTYVLK